MSSLHRGESVSLLYVEEAYSFSIQRRECLLYIQRRECPSAICRGGRVLLGTEERVSSLHRGESALLLYVEEADSFSIQRRECVFVAQRRECIFAICREGRLLLYTEERECLLYTEERVSLGYV